MTAIIHGCAGRSSSEPSDWTRSGTSDARRGAFFERLVARAIHSWLAGRPDDVHVFHDLVGLNGVSAIRNLAHLSSRQRKPLSLGTMNIDHLLLAGGTWLLIDAKGCGAGDLQVRARKGLLVQSDGTEVPQPWMNKRANYSQLGVVFRLTEGKSGGAAWVVPRTTTHHSPSIVQARFLADLVQVELPGEHGAWVRVHVQDDAEVRAGGLDELLPIQADSADLRDVERLQAYVSAPDVEYRLGAADAAEGPVEACLGCPTLRYGCTDTHAESDA